MRLFLEKNQYYRFRWWLSTLFSGYTQKVHKDNGKFQWVFGIYPIIRKTGIWFPITFFERRYMCMGEYIRDEIGEKVDAIINRYVDKIFEFIKCY